MVVALAGRAEFDGDGLRLHFDGLGDGADLQLEVDAEIVGDVEDDAGAILGLEAVASTLIE